MKLKVSLIIITFNQENFIADTIKSAINQNYKNLEIIISDDGSTDNTQKIIKKISEDYPNKIVSILNSNNVGVTKNCNRALNKVTGDYIAIMGGDDIIYPNKISRQIDFFEANNNLVLCGHLGENIDIKGNKILIDNKALVHGTSSKGRGPIMMIKRKHNPHPISLMVRRSAIPLHGFDEALTIASDYMFCLEILANGGEYIIINECLAQRRIHINNISRDYARMHKDLELTYQIFLKRYPEYLNECLNAIVDQVYYYRGVAEIASGSEGRNYLIKALQKKPLHYKAMFRYFQSLFMQLHSILKKLIFNSFKS